MASQKHEGGEMRALTPLCKKLLQYIAEDDEDGAVRFSTDMYLSKRSVGGMLASLRRKCLIRRTFSGKGKDPFTYVVTKGSRLNEALQSPCLGTPVQSPSMADHCRKNWGGYHIHKLFGSARRTAE